MKPKTSLITSTGPTKHELTDLLTEGINAVIEMQESYAKDWTRAMHCPPSRGGFSAHDAAAILMVTQQ